MIEVNITTEDFDIFRHCRKLVKQGKDLKDSVTFYRDGKPVFICNTLEGGAKWTVREDEKIGPVFMKHEPMSEEDRKRLSARRKK